MPLPLLFISSIDFPLLYKQHPDYKYLKVYGCAIFPLRPYNSHKFDFRSHECLFLGYSTTHKGYKCLSPSGKLIISKDVLFNEYKFPYPSLFSSTSTSSPCSSSSVSLNPMPIFGSYNPLPPLHRPMHYLPCPLRLPPPYLTLVPTPALSLLLPHCLPFLFLVSTLSHLPSLILLPLLALINLPHLPVALLHHPSLIHQLSTPCKLVLNLVL